MINYFNRPHYVFRDHRVMISLKQSTRNSHLRKKKDAAMIQLYSWNLKSFLFLLGKDYFRNMSKAIILSLLGLLLFAANFLFNIRHIFTTAGQRFTVAAEV